VNNKVFRFFASVKAAVVVIFGLAVALATATFMESAYDTPTAQYYIYKSVPFLILLTFFGINIICSALSRWPWKKRHTPFLVAHLGIIMLLTGSWMTQQFGLDGNMRISEGEISSTVELDNASLMLMTNAGAKRVPIKWLPPTVPFKKIALKDRGLPYDLVVDQYMTHADPVYNFLPDTNAVLATAKPAVQVNLKGGPMQISQDFWLWGGDPGWASIQAGPALLQLDVPGMARADKPTAGHPTLQIVPGPDGVQYIATSSEGKRVEGHLNSKEFSDTQVITPGWKNVSITFKKYFPRALPQTTYKEARLQYGPAAPPSAIHLVSGAGGEGAELWLGLGERAVLEVPGAGGVKQEVELGYFPERVTLPYAVRLDHFKIDHYDGTRDPSSYSSQVTVLDDGPAAVRLENNNQVVISMNEPLHYRGTALYQASYEDADPRPITSIFSVNRDPGRIWKYLGSLLIVLGSILLFVSRYWGKKAASPKGASA
jgi:hypothetical protein